MRPPIVLHRGHRTRRRGTRNLPWGKIPPTGFHGLSEGAKRGVPMPLWPILTPTKRRGEPTSPSFCVRTPPSSAGKHLESLYQSLQEGGYEAVAAAIHLKTPPATEESSKERGPVFAWWKKRKPTMRFARSAWSIAGSTSPKPPFSWSISGESGPPQTMNFI